MKDTKQWSMRISIGEDSLGAFTKDEFNTLRQSAKMNGRSVRMECIQVLKKHVAQMEKVKEKLKGVIK